MFSTSSSLIAFGWRDATGGRWEGHRDDVHYDGLRAPRSPTKMASRSRRRSEVRFVFAALGH